jgi:hypothetical protein
MRRCHCAANEHAAGRDVRTTIDRGHAGAIAGVTAQRISAARRRYPSMVVDFDLRQ